MERLAFSCN